MILDHLANAKNYVSLHPSFQKAFDYINSLDFDNLEDGKTTIDGDNLKAIVSNKNGMTKEESIAKFECHDLHIDIQVCVKSKETIAWKPRNTCTQVKGEYNPEKDVWFYADAPDTYFEMQEKQFCIFYPNDVHAPMIGEGPIKKLVIKVKI